MSMFEMEKPTKRTSALGVIMGLVIFMIALVWLLPALLSGDLRWFLPGVSAQPREVIIWAAGTATRLAPSDRDYAPITAAAHDAISHIYAGSEFGPSATTISAYRQQFGLELIYSEGLQIHSRFNLGRPHQVFIPLGPPGYAEGRFFVGGVDGLYWASGPRTAGLPAVLAAVQAALSGRGLAIPTPGP